MEPKVVYIISPPIDGDEDHQKAQQITADLGKHNTGRLVLRIPSYG
jgi:hypothetical protein